MKPRAARAYHVSFIQSKLSEFEEYHACIEDFIDGKIASLRKRLAKESRELSEDQWYELQELCSDEHFLFSEVFTQMLRASVVVAVYTLLETSLEKICSAERRLHGYSLKLGELAGGGIKRVKLYLSKVCGITFPGENQEWQQLMDLNKVRNAAVHAQGDIRRLRDPDSVRGLVTRTPGLSLRADSYLEINREYIESIIADVKSFFDRLHKAFPD